MQESTGRWWSYGISSVQFLVFFHAMLSKLLAVFVLERNLTSKLNKAKNKRICTNTFLVHQCFSHTSTDPLMIYVRYSRVVTSKCHPFCKIFHQQTCRLSSNPRNGFLSPHTDFLRLMIIFPCCPKSSPVLPLNTEVMLETKKTLLSV